MYHNYGSGIHMYCNFIEMKNSEVIFHSRLSRLKDENNIWLYIWNVASYVIKQLNYTKQKLISKDTFPSGYHARPPCISTEMYLIECMTSRLSVRYRKFVRC